MEEREAGVAAGEGCAAGRCFSACCLSALALGCRTLLGFQRINGNCATQQQLQHADSVAQIARRVGCQLFGFQGRELPALGRCDGCEAFGSGSSGYGVEPHALHAAAFQSRQKILVQPEAAPGGAGVVLRLSGSRGLGGHQHHRHCACRRQLTQRGRKLLSTFGRGSVGKVLDDSELAPPRLTAACAIIAGAKSTRLIASCCAGTAAAGVVGTVLAGGAPHPCALCSADQGQQRHFGTRSEIRKLRQLRGVPKGQHPLTGMLAFLPRQGCGWLPFADFEAKLCSQHLQGRSLPTAWRPRQ
mmetsp:Transcript_17563/g.52741  ORF Transcript_17563/g.52741 Transcript_17563/m.52741 type:complete len:300 (+) Transcript_17563:1895-2794(+)